MRSEDEKVQGMLQQMGSDSCLRSQKNCAFGSSGMSVVTC